MPPSIPAHLGSLCWTRSSRPVPSLSWGAPKQAQYETQLISHTGSRTRAAWVKTRNPDRWTMWDHSCTATCLALELQGQSCWVCAPTAIPSITPSFSFLPHPAAWRGITLPCEKRQQPERFDPAGDSPSQSSWWDRQSSCKPSPTGALLHETLPIAVPRTCPHAGPYTHLPGDSCCCGAEGKVMHRAMQNYHQ